MSFLKQFGRALRHKSYRNYYILQFFSFVGTWMQGTAQHWLIYRLTESAFFLGAVSFASAIPALFLSPVAGVLADNFKRKNVFLASQVLCLIHGIIISILFYNKILTEWHVLYLAIFLGIANSFDMPARQSFVPMLVLKEELTNAIALNSSMFNAARMIGPALAGFLIAAYDEGVCFLFNAISYVPIIIFLFFVSTREQIIKKSSSPFVHLKEGFKFAMDNKPIKALLILVGIFSFWGISFSTLLPIFSEEILHKGSQGLGILACVSGIGAVCGGVFLASQKNIIDIKKFIAICSMVTSVSLIIFAFSKIFLLSLLTMFASGFCFIIIFAGSNTLLQAMSPDFMQGRIVSLFSTMLMGMFPLGSLAIGGIAQCQNASIAVACGGFICLIAGNYFNSIVSSLRKESQELLKNQEKSEES